MRTFDDVFGRGRPLIGVVHLLPLPGAPRHERPLADVRQRALTDAAAYLDHGADGVIVENFGDAPFHRDAAEPHVVAAMAAIAADVKRLAGRRPVGVNVLRNASLAALGVAVGAGLDFIRVNVLCGVAVADQGLIEGRAAELLRARRALAPGVLILADLRVKHAAPLRKAPPEIEVEELIERSLADAVLVTGATTGRAPDAAAVERVAAAAGRAPVLVASGATAGGVAAFAAARGFVVGSSLEAAGRAGNPVEGRRVREFRAALDRAAPARTRGASRGGKRSRPR